MTLICIYKKKTSLRYLLFDFFVCTFITVSRTHLKQIVFDLANSGGAEYITVGFDLITIGLRGAIASSPNRCANDYIDGNRKYSTSYPYMQLQWSRTLIFHVANFVIKSVTGFSFCYNFSSRSFHFTCPPR